MNTSFFSISVFTPRSHEAQLSVAGGSYSLELKNVGNRCSSSTLKLVIDKYDEFMVTYGGIRTAQAFGKEPGVAGQVFVQLSYEFTNQSSAESACHRAFNALGATAFTLRSYDRHC